MPLVCVLFVEVCLGEMWGGYFYIVGLENFPANDLVDDLRPVLEWDTYTPPCLDSTTSSEIKYFWYIHPQYIATDLNDTRISYTQVLGYSIVI